MNYAPAQQIKSARHIARSAQRQIKYKTGMRVNIMLYPAEDTFKTPEQMLKIIALSLDMSYDCFRMKSRAREIAELRFIGALFLRMNFTYLTLSDIATLFGGQDHTSIISGMTRAHNLIYTGDLRFLKKYNTALKSVNLWLRKEESDYASANSA